MSRDSVAVLLDMVIEGAKAYGHHSTLRSSDDETVAYWKRYVADGKAKLLAALTREAAPQASGGDDVVAAAVWEAMGDENYLMGAGPFEAAHPDDQDAARRIAAAALSAQPKCATCKGRGYTDEGDPEIGRAIFECEACKPTTTDSAIQSQQGATGGDGRYARHSILRQHAAQSVAKSGSGAILVSAAAVSDLFADLDAALAHPQAAGSAVGEACNHERSYGAPWRCAKCGLRMDEATTTPAVSVAAPVGVDAKDAARWRHVREMFAEEMLETLFGVDPSVECNATDGLDAACDADIESGAALEKERAE